MYYGYDDYGLSMIFVWIDPNGELVYSNTRWNHEAEYAPGHGIDTAMTEVDIANLMGVPFKEVFNVKTFEDVALELQKRLDNGEKAEDVFDKIGDKFGRNGRFVCYGYGWNLIDEKTHSKILLPIWFDEVEYVPEGIKYLTVFHNQNKSNIISVDRCEYVWKKPLENWFDGGCSIKDNVAVVNRIEGENSLSNILSLDTGELLYEWWFRFIGGAETTDKCYLIRVGSKYNVINYGNNYKLVWNHPINEWFDEIGDEKHRDDYFSFYFYLGWRRVRIGDKWNFMNIKGDLIWKYPYEEWFDSAYEFNESLQAEVIMKDENNVTWHNFISSNGKLLVNGPISEWIDITSKTDRYFGVASVIKSIDKNAKGRENLRFNLARNGQFVLRDWAYEISYEGSVIRIEINKGDDPIFIVRKTGNNSWDFVNKFYQRINCDSLLRRGFFSS
jgi:hypothetical protein